MSNPKDGKIDKKEQTRYCLYARKSSESDERQAMSIDSQIKEMTTLAKREGLLIKEVRQESHSAKSSGLRPVFNQLLTDIKNGIFNAILTWAPDRLSRNAGDLGTLVDLMDQEKLLAIRTFSQSFSNNPNEKFLLMILCSQAKLENDNRGINVKRGLRAKCEAGWKPNKAPIGYLNVMSENRISYVIIDKKRAPAVKQMFLRVGNKGQSGRVVKAWLDQIGFTTKSGSKLALSNVYGALKNPYYYGDFKFAGKIYKGKHKPIITRKLFDKVQKRLIVPPREWHKKIFPFRQLCKCGSCGASITAEEKYKKLKYNGFKKYIYYHCTRSIDYDCDEPYITEDDLAQQIIAQIDDIKIDEKYLTNQLKGEIERFHSLRGEVLHQEFLTGNLNQFDYPQKEPLDRDMAKDYLLHVLKAGSAEDRIKILSAIKTKFILHNKELSIK